MSFAKSLRKTVTKNKSSTVAFDFVEEEIWSSLGNFATNKMLSGRYDRGLLFGRSMALGGMSGSGKSLYAATACAHAQKEVNAFVVWLDAEKANTGISGRTWLEKLGVKTDEDNLLYTEIATIEDVKSLVASIAAEMRSNKEVRPVVVVIDSVGMILSETQMTAAIDGEVKGDQGQMAKQKKDMIIAITHLSTRLPLATIPIVHTMASQDKYDPDEKLTSGRGVEYAASSVLVVNKMKLRGDQVEKSSKIEIDKEKIKKVIGIRSKVQVYKSRFSKPNESIVVQIPYPQGLDPYSGLFELMKDTGEIHSPAVGWYAYQPADGELVKFREKDFRDHADAIMKASDDGLIKEVLKTSDDDGSEAEEE